MNCHDVDAALSRRNRLDAARLPATLEGHIAECPGCQRLLSVEQADSATDPVPLRTLHRAERAMLVDLRPVVPLAPASRLFTAFAAIFVAIAASGVYRLQPLAVARMGPLRTVIVVGVLTGVAALLIAALLRQMAPGWRLGRRLPDRFLSAALFFALAVLMAALFQEHREHSFWKAARGCMTTGIAWSVPAGIMFWLLLRRGAILRPPVTGATAGLLAGLAGVVILQIHCPLLDLRHILAGHLGIAATCMLAGLAMGVLAGHLPLRDSHRTAERH